MFPVRCYTCNATLAQHHPRFREGRRQGRPIADLLADFGLERVCCRRMFLGHVDNMEEQTRFSNKDAVLDANGTRLLRYVKHSRTVSCD